MEYKSTLLETEIKSLVKNYQYRYEADLATVMKMMLEVVNYSKMLETRLTALETDRVSYLEGRG